MKVAIVGAGIAGLSSAIELQRHGITPTIFEKTKILGDKPGSLIATLRMFHRSIRSPMSFIESKYGIRITPEHPINEMVMVAPNKTVSTKGHHGYAFLKGIEKNSLEHQLAAYIDAPIQFDSDIKIEEIKNDYDHIVVATGSRGIPNAFSLWTTTFMAKSRLATVSGSFNKNALIFYLNKNYGKDGYGYLLARSENAAELLLAVSDITTNKLDYYWNEFLITENIKTTIIKYHDFEHDIGYPSTNQFENLYFAGNSGGMIDDFLGFGTLRAIESGILAARAIVQNLDYNRLLEPFKKEVSQMYEYRKMLNVLTNKDLDMDMSIIGVPGLKHMIYNNPLYKATYGLLAPKVITHFKKKNYSFSLNQRK